MTTHPHGKSDDQHPHSGDQARAIFRRAYLEGGEVVYSRHASERMKENNLDAEDLMQLARRGRVFNAPELHDKTGHWTYRIEMNDPPARAVFEILGPRRIQLITVFLD